MINVIESLAKSECCFCLISVARNVARTPPPVQQSLTFQIHQRVTEKRKGFSQTTNPRWRQVTRCVGHEIALLPEYAGKINPCSNLTECAEKPEDTSCTSPSARKTRINQVSHFREYAEEPNKSYCTPRSAQDRRIRTAQSARTQNLLLAEFTKRRKCEKPG